MAEPELHLIGDSIWQPDGSKDEMWTDDDLAEGDFYLSLGSNGYPLGRETHRFILHADGTQTDLPD